MSATPDSGQSPTTDELPYIYPAHWEADVVLRDGATAHLRPILPSDREAYEAMYASQSENSIYYRFFAPKPKLSEKELTRFITVDHIDRVAFVLYLGSEIIGIGRYDRGVDPTTGEVAFFISDRHHGRGIGSILLEHLAAAALERGIHRFTAEVLPQNRAMLNVFADAGYEVSREIEDGFVMLEFDIDPTDRSREVMESREHRAEAKSITELLAPERIAVVGESATWESAAQPMLTNLVEGDFSGTLFAFSLDSDQPAAATAEDYQVLDSLNDSPETIDLALVTVPVERVAEAVEVCGAAGVRGAVIYTRGFADDGARGRARQKALVRSARQYGMRIIGPASFGVLNNNPEIRLDATITHHDPKPGKLGLFSQSSAIGAVFSHTAVRKNIGVSSLVSAGNRADVSGNDLMQYWEDDPHTSVCALYLESIGNPRKFSRIARRLSRTKPVIVTKNSLTGVKLPPGHAVRTSIAPADALNSMFNQAGVISAESSEQVLEIAQLLVSAPLPTGRRLAVVSNAMALGQLIVDAAVERDIEVKLTENRLDLDEEGLKLLAEVVDSALESTDIDALIGIFLTEGFTDPVSVAQILLESARRADKPVVAVFPGLMEYPAQIQGIYNDDAAGVEPAVSGLPCFRSPVPAVNAMASAMNYVEWREKEEGIFAVVSGVKPKDTAEFIASRMEEVSGEQLLALSQADTSHILAEYGIELLPSRVVESVEEAQAAAEELGGYPVVLKSTDEFLGRRLDLGAIRLNIEGPDQLAHEFEALKRTLTQYQKEEIALQKQVKAGQATILEAIEDPLLGPVVSFGMSGDSTALLEDWAHRIPPLTQRDIFKMVRSPKAAVRLFGENNLAAVRVDLLEDLVARVALLKDNHPEIASIQLSPVIVTDEGLTVARAQMKLGNPKQRTDSARRTMSRSES